MHGKLAVPPVLRPWPWRPCPGSPAHARMRQRLTQHVSGAAQQSPAVLAALAPAVQGGYGRQRMWASIGWGGMSPVAGVVVARHGLQAAFGVYFLVVALAFVPTCLLPISILSSGKPVGTGPWAGAGVSPEGSEAKLGGAGATNRPQGGGRAGSRGSRGSSSGSGEIEVGSRSGSAARVLALPEKRARMDSDLASRVSGRVDGLKPEERQPAGLCEACADGQRPRQPGGWLEAWGVGSSWLVWCVPGPLQRAMACSYLYYSIGHLGLGCEPADACCPAPATHRQRQPALWQLLSWCCNCNPSNSRLPACWPHHTT